MADSTRIHLYTLCWNERRMLPFFFRHYDPIVDRYVVFDDGSTDGSLEILERHPRVEVRPFVHTDPDSFVRSELDLFDACWHESRGVADWVLLVNMDEHLFHPAGLRAYLQHCSSQGLTAVRATGYQMVSTCFPQTAEPLSTQVRHGMRWQMMDKLGAFDPDALTSLGFRPGRHSDRPTGRVQLPTRSEVALLHYKYLGLDYLIERTEQLRPGFGTGDRESNFGHKYFWDAAQIQADFEAVLAAAREVVPARRRTEIAQSKSAAPDPRPVNEPESAQGPRTPRLPS